jgi:hypothetical protein
MDAKGKRKLPWFIDPIEGRLKIERNALLSAYFNIVRPDPLRHTKPS